MVIYVAADMGCVSLFTAPWDLVPEQTPSVSHLSGQAWSSVPDQNIKQQLKSTRQRSFCDILFRGLGRKQER